MRAEKLLSELTGPVLLSKGSSLVSLISKKSVLNHEKSETISENVR